MSEQDTHPRQADYERGGWWICSDFRSHGGKRLLGPFLSIDLTNEVRRYYEMAHAPRTFCIDFWPLEAADGSDVVEEPRDE